MVNQIALIPARGGSKRVPGKNTRLLGGKPLIVHTINAAKLSGVFDEIFVSTDDDETAQIAMENGVSVPELRPREFATDVSPDIEWISHALINWVNSRDANLAILRPTSPLRKPTTIRNAFKEFYRNQWADSLRAMQLVTEHPGKMWRIGKRGEAIPFTNQGDRDIPTHSSPTNSLEKIWIQNASLEIVKSSTILNKGSLSGDFILKYEMPGLEGYDINSTSDWSYLEFLIKSEPALLIDPSWKG